MVQEQKLLIFAQVFLQCVKSINEEHCDIPPTCTSSPRAVGRTYPGGEVLQGLPRALVVLGHVHHVGVFADRLAQFRVVHTVLSTESAASKVGNDQKLDSLRKLGDSQTPARKVACLLSLFEPSLCDVGLIVGDGDPVTYTQHAQQVQVPVVLWKRADCDDA